MTKLERKIAVRFGFYSELSNEDRLLFECAINARAKAQCPYSHYKVGAAIFIYDEGVTKVYTGCNVERASYTQSTHAEQNAIDTMIAVRGTRKILKVCVVGATDSREISYAPAHSIKIYNWFDQKIPVPCGHCLQIIWEHCGNDQDVLLYGITVDGLISVVTIGDAFPMRFGPSDLGVEYK